MQSHTRTDARRRYRLFVALLFAALTAPGCLEEEDCECLPDDPDAQVEFGEDQSAPIHLYLAYSLQTGDVTLDAFTARQTRFDFQLRFIVGTDFRRWLVDATDFADVYESTAPGTRSAQYTTPGGATIGAAFERLQVVSIDDRRLHVVGRLDDGTPFTIEGRLSGLHCTTAQGEMVGPADTDACHARACELGLRRLTNSSLRCDSP